MNSPYIILDPSCLTSENKVRDLTKIINELIKLQKEKIKVFLPFSVDDIYNKKIEDSFKIWDKKFNIEKGIKILEYLKKKYPDITFAKEFKDGEKLGKISIDYVKEKLGAAGNFIFNIMLASSKYRSIIISFSEKTMRLIRKLGSTIVRFESEYKKNILIKVRVYRALRFSIFLADSAHVFEEIGNIIGSIIGHPEIIGVTSRLGAFFVANG